MNIKKIFFIYFFQFLNLFSGINLEDYQDVIIDDKVVHSGVRECSLRYDVIKNILNQYKRPITVLDLGAAEGYFSFRIANEYDSTCIMIEGDSRRRLLDLCKANYKLNNIVLLQKNISVNELQRLAECEHFDIVLAFNLIHWFEGNWKAATDEIINLGDNILIETPPNGDKTFGEKYLGQINKYIKNNCHGIIIGKFPRHTSKKNSKMYWIKKQKNSIEKAVWGRHGKTDKLIGYKIESDFNKKVFKKYIKEKNKTKLSESRDWFKGINLYTFKRLNGIYPSLEVIKKQLQKYKGKKLSDIKIGNFIIQGNNIEIIDYNDSRNYAPRKKMNEPLINELMDKLISVQYFET